MADYRPMIGTHACNDDPRLYEFVRNSGIPRGTFDRPRISPDGWVVIVCSLIGVAMLGVLIAERVG